jgi:putative transposase
MRYVRIASMRRFHVKKRVSEDQIIRILKAADRGETTISEVCRSHGISENTFYLWRRQYTGLSVPEVRRLHAIEKEHARHELACDPPTIGSGTHVGLRRSVNKVLFH